MSNPREDDLIDRARGGDRTAQDALVSLHQDAVYRFARSMASDDAAAEDILQETFVSAVTHLESYRGEGSLRSWLFTIAKRKTIRAGRKRAGEPAEMESLEDLGQRAGWGANDDLEARIAEHDAVRHAFRSLTADDREVLFLRDVEGLSGEEAAAVLGVGLRALKSRLHRARLRLTAALRKGDRDGARS